MDSLHHPPKINGDPGLPLSQRNVPEVLSASFLGSSSTCIVGIRRKESTGLARDVMWRALGMGRVVRERRCTLTIVSLLRSIEPKFRIATAKYG